MSAPQVLVPFATCAVARLRDGAFEGDGVERFFNVVERAVPHGFHRRPDRRVGRDHQHLHVQPTPLDFADELEAVHARHLQVGYDDVHALARQLGERFARAGARRHLVIGLSKHVAHGFARRSVVIDHEDAKSVIRLRFATHPIADPSRVGTPQLCYAVSFSISARDLRRRPHRTTRNLDRERRAALRAVHRRDRATVCLGHVINDCQPKTGAVLLRAVKWFERATPDLVR